MAVQREWCLHRGVCRFVSRAVKPPFIFMNHDRAAKQSDTQHIWEKARGVAAGFPDTSLWCLGAVFLCELKWGKNTADHNQAAMGASFNAMDFPWCVAHSVTEYANFLWEYSAPLLGNWREVAAHEDEMVLGDIRTQEEKARNAPKLMKRRVGKGITSASLVLRRAE